MIVGEVIGKLSYFVSILNMYFINNFWVIMDFLAKVRFFFFKNICLQCKILASVAILS